MKALRSFALLFFILILTCSLISCENESNDSSCDNNNKNCDSDDDDNDEPACKGCLIENICYADNETNPANVCEICIVTESQGNWSNNDFTVCHDGVFCNGTSTCSGGTCSQHSGDPCPDDGVFCNGEEFCDEEAEACDSTDPCLSHETCNETRKECWDPQKEVFIPDGTFWMGCESNDTECYGDESPHHEITLSSYYIDTYEVTNEAYAVFLNDNGNDCDGSECVFANDAFIRVHESGGVWTADSGFEDHPMSVVTWYGAKALCTWSGGRLPTEAEWEKAAKGAVEHYIYPWGHTWAGNAANNWENGDPWETGSEPLTNPVGYYDGSDHGGDYQTTDGSSPYGLHDMAGNVWEWVNDWYDAGYYLATPSTDPPGPSTGTHRIIRGGCWGDLASVLRTSSRSWGDPYVDANYLNGFRCARD